MCKQKRDTLMNFTTEKIMNNLLKSIKAYDEYTYTHSIQVGNLRREIARNLNLSEKQVQEVYLAGVLHDVGKLHVPISITNKKGFFTPDERMVMLGHAAAGFNILNSTNAFGDAVCKAVLYHHENIDGSGYMGLFDEDIPLYAKILRIADTYEAITHDRPYKTRQTARQAVNIIEEELNICYDVDVYEAFMKVVLSEITMEESVS